MQRIHFLISALRRAGGHGAVGFMAMALLTACLSISATADEIDLPPVSTLPMVTLSHKAMSAEFNFLLYGDKELVDNAVLKDAAEKAFKAVDDLENHITTWKPESDASQMNEKAAAAPFAVDPDLFRLMLSARHYYEESQGVFDVTVGPLLALWGFYGKQGQAPSEPEIDAALAKTGFKHIRLDEKAHTVFYEKPGMRVDFGGIGKGLALDASADILRRQGIKNFRIHSATSSIIACGNPPDEDGWSINIRLPYGDEQKPVDTVIIHNESLSTSSAQERHVEYNGKRYGHIFDPRTGRPADTKVKSATVIAPTGTESDALSTAFFILGVDGAREYCRKHPEVRALLVVDHEGTPEIVRINFPEK